MDTHGVWHVHVQTSATSSQAATPSAVTKPHETTMQSLQPPPWVPTPATTCADSACTSITPPALPPQSIHSSRDVLSPRPNGNLISATALASGGSINSNERAVPGATEESSMPQLRIRVPKSNVRQLESLSQSRDTATMQSCRSTQSGTQDVCDTESALARRSTADCIISKQSTASASSAASVESDVQNVPLVCPFSCF